MSTTRSLTTNMCGSGATLDRTTRYLACLVKLGGCAAFSSVIGAMAVRASGAQLKIRKILRHNYSTGPCSDWISNIHHQKNRMFKHGCNVMI